MESYREQLERLQGRSKGMMRLLMNKAKRDPRRILFPEGGQPKILQAAQILLDQGIAIPVLMGDEARIRATASDLDLDLEGVEIFDHNHDPAHDEVIERLYQRRQRRGVSRAEAHSIAKHREAYAMVMVGDGRADGVVTGLTKNYSESLRPALELVGTQAPSRALGVYLVFTNQGLKFFADTTVTSNSVHPGIINTNLGRHFPWWQKIAASLIGWTFMKSVEAGAATQCYVATAPALDGVSGYYFADCNPLLPDPRVALLHAGC